MFSKSFFFIWPIAWHGPSSLGHANTLLLVDSLGRKTRETEIIIIYQRPIRKQSLFHVQQQSQITPKTENRWWLTDRRASERQSKPNTRLFFILFLFIYKLINTIWVLNNFDSNYQISKASSCIEAQFRVSELPRSVSSPKFLIPITPSCLCLRSIHRLVGYAAICLVSEKISLKEQEKGNNLAFTKNPFNI